MSPEITPIYNEAFSLFEKYFYSELEKKLLLHSTFLKEFKPIFDDFYKKVFENKDEPTELARLNKGFNQKIFDKIKIAYPQKYTNFKDDFYEYNEYFDEFLLGTEEKRKRVQDEDRFIPIETDSFRLKNQKKIKRFFFKISQLPIKAGNIFRKKSNKKPPRSWHHFIPLRNLISKEIKNGLPILLLPDIEKTFQAISTLSFTIFKIADDINKDLFKYLDDKQVINKPDYEKLINEQVQYLKNISSEIKYSIEDKLKEKFVEFESIYNKAGTIEIPERRLSRNKVDKKRKELFEDYSDLSRGWANNLFAIYDKWRLVEEINIVRSHTLSTYYIITAECRIKINEKIIPFLDKIIVQLESTKENISDASAGKEKLSNNLLEEKEKNYSKLTEDLIPTAIDALLDQNIPDLIEEMEDAVKEILDRISEDRAVLKSSDYSRPVKSSEIDIVIPSELIIHETLPQIAKKDKILKQSLVENLEEIQKEILDLDQISDFTLESAIALLKTEGKTAEESKSLATEGVERAIAKGNKTKENLIKINEEINSKLKETVDLFSNDLHSLTTPQKVLEIKLRVAKAKALKRTEAYRKKVLEIIKNLIPVIIGKSKELFSKSSGYYYQLKKRLGIASKATTISTEVSDFLAETQSSITKLPYVYQRLFIIEPLPDKRFFYGREYELGKLNISYSNWQKEYYAPAVLIGEKGSGTTSTLNVFLNNIDNRFDVKRTAINETIFTEEKFLDFFGNIFSAEFKFLDDLIDHINNGTKQIVIIENIQRFYLKSVGGFRSLRMFFELISRTNKNIFWVTTITLYAWEYLSKVLNIPDHIGYIIKQQNLKYEQVIEIVSKRHRVSGYNIYFEPSPADLKDKSYKKLSEPEKQNYLRKEFFSGLNKFTKSNISLALLFWLRSTSDVSKDTITIKSLKELDFSFLNSLSSEKIFTLHALLLHDGLTEDSHSIIFNTSKEQSRLLLLLLLDDGIIIRKNEIFIINPLLYRQTVSLLQAKNILH